jgi:hypothetical protein
MASKTGIDCTLAGLPQSKSRAVELSYQGWGIPLKHQNSQIKQQEHAKRIAQLQPLPGIGKGW